MNSDIYTKLADVLNTLPNGFPPTKTGIELALLKMVFTPDEAELFCDLQLTPETAAEISQRTGRPLENLEHELNAMWHRGEIHCSTWEGVKRFKMIPWVVGIYELQLERMNREFAELCEQYKMVLGPQLLMARPQLMQVLPIEQEIPVHQEALPYQQVSHLIQESQSFGVRDCVCNKNKKLVGEGCDKPPGVCMTLSKHADAFEGHPMVRTISRDEANQTLKLSEEAALVHLTANIMEDQAYICNCCSCCCPMLGAVKAFNSSQILNSSYAAEIDPGLCDGCGVCKDERCQVNAILAGSDAYQIIDQTCIGCGLCVDTCPTSAIRLIHKPPRRGSETPLNEEQWYAERGRWRGVDFSAYIQSGKTK